MMLQNEYNKNVGREFDAAIQAAENDLVNQLKVNILKDLRKNQQIADEPYLYTNGQKYSRNQLALEIEAESEAGLRIMSSVLYLSVDIMARGRGVSWKDHEELQAENSALKKLIFQLHPYIKDLNADNFDEPSVGIFMDRTLESLAAEVEVICNNLQPAAQ